ncbi:histidine phosphatase family protein [Patescibacteria group bacterium]|nr:histidine phosphatase family protein [Patescibacteria group bacterium]MBU1028940.1 histidine phosphatase family protein [Patescibacteria group bacterium]MBU1916207.1 histidine phosphatase family protein [Patescibacteria group bacterium]
MPIDLVLVRHGESEGNVANKLSRRGDDSAFTEDFLRRHSSTWRLTERGLEQARQAGEWIRKNIGDHFDRYYVSEYVRAKETAARLGLPTAKWYCEYYLRERDYGLIDVMTDRDRRERFSAEIARREADGLYWIPPNGESLVQASLRVDRVLNTLHRECADKRVIIVSHGEIMWLFRIRLERLTQRQYRALVQSKRSADRIYNCQIIHYTRRDPETGYLAKYLRWRRSVCPTDLSLSQNEWETITRPSFSNEDLLAEIEPPFKEDA